MTGVTREHGFKATIEMDIRALGSGPKGALFLMAAILAMNKFSAVLLFRMSASLYTGGAISRFCSSAIHRLNMIVNSCEISPAAQIGPGLYLPHPIGIVVGPCRAGVGLTIMQNVTIGLRTVNADQMDYENYPNFGSNVRVGPGAAILGGVSIGDKAILGANAVVLDSVPASAIMVGNPARVARIIGRITNAPI